MELTKEGYTQEDVEQAVDNIRAGSSMRSVASAFRIPKSTLFDKMKYRYSKSGAGSSSWLSMEEEAKIAEWVNEMAASGLPVCEEILRISVGQFANKIGKKDLFSAGVPSRGWVAKFLKRHPDISKRTANQLSKKRIVNETEVRAWFTEVEDYMSSSGFLEVLSDSDRVFNMDESSFEMAPNPKKPKVFANKKHKNVHSVQGNSNRESYTVMMAGSAAGVLVPPLILFPFKERLAREIVQSIPKGWGVGRTDRGWMNSGAFYEYLANVFYPFLLKKNTNFPVIVFVDGHRSHATYETVQFCKEKQIILVSLPPNCTHFIQPLDVSFFKPMKDSWDMELIKWRFKNGGAMIRKPDFAPLLECAINGMKDKEATLVNGFRKCGLHPWNPNAIDYSAFPNPDSVSPFRRENISVHQDTLTAEPSIPGSVFLRELNKRLSPEHLREFEAQRYNLMWTGNAEASYLFDLWRNAKDEVEGPPEFFEIDPTLIGLDVTAEISIVSESENLEPDVDMNEAYKFPLTSIDYPNILLNESDDLVYTLPQIEYVLSDTMSGLECIADDNVPGTSFVEDYDTNPPDEEYIPRLAEQLSVNVSDGNSTEETQNSSPDNVEYPMQDNDIGNRGAQDKAFVVFPEKLTTSSQRKRRVLPAVATSEVWEQIYREEENFKEGLESAKRQRIEDRKEKSKLKEMEKENVKEKKKEKKRVQLAEKEERSRMLKEERAKKKREKNLEKKRKLLMKLEQEIRQSFE